LHAIYSTLWHGSAGGIVSDRVAIVNSTGTDTAHYSLFGTTVCILVADVQSRFREKYVENVKFLLHKALSKVHMSSDVKLDTGNTKGYLCRIYYV